MALQKKVDLMEPGERLTISGGEFAGLACTVKSNIPYPDEDTNRRRKIDVTVHTPQGDEEVLILPRMIDDGGRYAAYQAEQLGGIVPGTITVGTPQTVVAAPVAPPGEVSAPITSVDDARLDPYRPDPTVVDSYISRQIPGQDRPDVEFLLDFYDRRRNIMLIGDTQAGKTMLVQVMAVLAGRKRAKDLGIEDWQNAKPLPVFTLSGSSGVTDFDLFGQPTIYNEDNGVERLVWLLGMVALASEVGGILYLDEVNMMSERVTASLHPITDYRRHFVNRQKAVKATSEEGTAFIPEIVEASDDLWVIGTINPGYKGAGAMNEAFTNRFQWIPWGYDEKVEKALVSYQSVRLLGDALRAARDQRALSTPVGTGTLQELCSNTDQYGSETALWMLVSMFQANEQPAVEQIITDRSIRSLLDDEKLARDNGAI
jgi:MoxR-like ATPase